MYQHFKAIAPTTFSSKKGKKQMQIDYHFADKLPKKEQELAKKRALKQIKNKKSPKYESRIVN